MSGSEKNSNNIISKVWDKMFCCKQKRKDQANKEGYEKDFKKDGETDNLKIGDDDDKAHNC